MSQQLNETEKKFIRKILKDQDIDKEAIKIYIGNQMLTSKQFVYILKQSNCINIERIQVLNLYLNYLDDQSIKYLCLFSYKWNRLKNLLLQYNNITMKGIKYLSLAASQNCFPQLEILNLNGNKIGSSFENQFSKNKQEFLLNFANKNTKLKELCLNQNKINDNDIKILFQNQLKNKIIFHCLQRVQLIENHIKGEGIKVFIEQYVQYPELICLHLQKNQIDKNGIKYIVSLKSDAFKHLQYLILDDNITIRDEGVHELIKGCNLGALPLLDILSLKNVNLSHNGFEYFIKLFNPLTVPYLSFIDIQNNLVSRNKLKLKAELYQKFYPKVQEIQI